MAAEMVRIPERKLTVLQRGAEIAQERVELVLGVPGHDRAREGPGGRGERPDGEDGGERQPRLAARAFGVPECGIGAHHSFILARRTPKAGAGASSPIATGATFEADNLDDGAARDP